MLCLVEDIEGRSGDYTVTLRLVGRGQFLVVGGLADVFAQPDEVLRKGERLALVGEGGRVAGAMVELEWVGPVDARPIVATLGASVAGLAIAAAYPRSTGRAR